jgi:hypothetical protein
VEVRFSNLNVAAVPRRRDPRRSRLAAGPSRPQLRGEEGAPHPQGRVRRGHTALRPLARQRSCWRWPASWTRGEVTYNGHGMDEFVPQKTSAFIRQRRDYRQGGPRLLRQVTGRGPEIRYVSKPSRSPGRR